MLRPDAHRDAQHRRTRRTWNPLYGYVLGRTALVAGTLRPAYGHALGTCADTRQRRDDASRRCMEPRRDAARLDARRSGPDARRNAYARQRNETRRLPHGHDRQMGRGRPDERKHAQQNGLRRIFRLHLPASGTLLLPSFPLGERPPRISRQPAPAAGHAARRWSRSHGSAKLREVCAEHLQPRSDV